MPTHVSNPFVDFKYGDYYASDFHLLRVSNGSRYNNNILPTLTEKTAEVPGGDGMYLFNTYYKQRQFTIDVAFDSVTETDIHNIRNWLSGKEVKPLIFDELPDRQYFAKVTSSPTLKFIPFDQYNVPHYSSNVDTNLSNDNDNTQVVYKGEGSIQFTCYDPFAYSLNSYHAYTEVGGNYPTSFQVTTMLSVSQGDTISVLENSNPVYSITIQKNSSDTVLWDSATGMVSDSNGPLPFTGNSMGVLEPGKTYTISVTGILTYRNKYL